MSLPKNKVILIEDHHEALPFWKKLNFSNIPLVHIDAHSDFNPSFLKTNKTDIGNFIYVSLIKNITSDLYWVIPGKKQDFSKYLPTIYKILAELSLYDTQVVKNIILLNDFLETKIIGHKFIISTLDGLPVIKEPALLDIDTDFFVVPTLALSKNTEEIGKRMPWITARDFYSKIIKKVLNPSLITIAYSVNGGWTPMIYKTLADKIALKFDKNNLRIKKNISAGDYFYKFRQNFEKNNIHQARKFYKKAIRLNPLYDNTYNNYGYLHLLRGNIDNAYNEFFTMTKINRRDRYSFFGLAIIYLSKFQYQSAKKALTEIIKIDGSLQDLEIYIYLAYVEYKLNNFKKAEKYLNICIKHHAYEDFSRDFKKVINNHQIFKDFSKNNRLTFPFWIKKLG